MSGLRDALTRWYDDYRPGKDYRPGGRDWQFRHPRMLEVVLTLLPFGRQWVYGHWPIRAREAGTIW